MLRRIMVVLAVIGLLAGLGAMQSREERWQNQEAIQRIISAVEAAWNARDVAAFGSQFTPEADFVNVRGWYSLNGIANPPDDKSKELFAKSEGRIISTFRKVGRREDTVEHYRFPRPDVAVVGFTWEVRYKNVGEEERSAEVSSLMVLTKDAGQWRIETFQNTLVSRDGIYAVPG